MAKKQGLPQAYMIEIARRVLQNYTVEDWKKASPDHPTNPQAMLLDIEVLRVGAGATKTRQAAELGASAIQAYLLHLGITVDHARVSQMPDHPARIVVHSYSWDFVRGRLYGQ